MKRTKRAPTPAVAPLVIDLHYGQTLAWQARATHRIVSVMAGTGGGKTWLGPRWLYPLIREKPGATFLFLEPTYKMLKRVMLPIVRAFYDPLGVGMMRLADMTYDLASGGRIVFGSIDNPQSLQGLHVDGAIWCDEIGLYPEEAWDVVLQRAAYHRAPILNTSTPYTLPWVEQRLAAPARDSATASDYALVQFASIMNPAYPVDQYYALKRQWAPDKFARLMDGLFVQISGLMFDSFNEAQHLATITPLDGRRLHIAHPTLGAWDADLVRVEAGQDWGWHDPAVLLIAGEDALGRRYVFQEDQDSFVQVDGDPESLDCWKGRALAAHVRWGLDALYCDPSMPAYIQTYQAAHLPARGADNRIEYGTSEVNGAFHSDRLFIAQNACPNLVRTIGAYVRQRQPGGDGFLPQPAPRQDDHSCDALRYLIAGDGARSAPSLGAPLIMATFRRGR